MHHHSTFLRRLASFAYALLSMTVGAVCGQPYFELRLYHLKPGKTDATLERFREHMADIYTRHSIEPLGFWTSTNSNQQEFLVYLLKAESQAVFAAGFKAFLADPEFGVAYGEAMKKHGNTVDKIEQLPLQPFDWSPVFTPKNKETPRAFELRIYSVSPGRMEDYAANYRDARLPLFAAHGFENLGFWQAIGTNRPNTFVMMLAHDSAAKISEAKAAYHKDPKWDAGVKPLDDAGKPTLGVESFILTPTAFSKTR